MTMVLRRDRSCVLKKRLNRSRVGPVISVHDQVDQPTAGGKEQQIIQEIRLFLCIIIDYEVFLINK
jgi:hypothetical protein